MYLQSYMHNCSGKIHKIQIGNYTVEGILASTRTIFKKVFFILLSGRRKLEEEKT